MSSVKTIILKYLLVCVFLVSPCCVHRDRRPDQTVSVVPSPRFVLFVFSSVLFCSCDLSLAASESARREPSCPLFAGVYAAVRGSPIPRFAGVHALSITPPFAVQPSRRLREFSPPFAAHPARRSPAGLQSAHPPSPLVVLLRRCTRLPGGGSYVRPLSCVSCVPASCFLIWLVSCPRFMSLLVNSIPGVCL